MHVTTLTNPCNASSLAQRPTWHQSWSWHDHVHIPALKSSVTCHVANSEDLSKIYVPVNKRVRSYVPSVEVKKNCPASHHLGLLPWIGTRHLHLSHRLHSLPRQTGTPTLSKFPNFQKKSLWMKLLLTLTLKMKKRRTRNTEMQRTRRESMLSLSLLSASGHSSFLLLLLDGDPKLDHKFN